MWHQVLVPTRLLIIPVLIMTTRGQAPRNHSDVIVTYSNHAEADEKVEPEQQPVVPQPKVQEPVVKEPVVPEPVVLDPKTEPEPKSPKAAAGSSDEYLYVTGKEGATEIAPLAAQSEVEEPVRDDVVFLPNDRDHDRNDDYAHKEAMGFQHILGGYKTVDDVMKKPKSTTENVGDIIFVSGKNHETDTEPEKTTPSNKGTYVDAPYGEEITEKPKPVKMDCKHLDCDNNVQSICGAKFESKRWRYRLFLNECYFRKVNCNFRNVESRFKEVSLEFCQHVGIHHGVKPDPKPVDPFKVKPVQVTNTRRRGSYRRSLTLDVDGSYCSHPCPTACPDNYEPECAVTNGGEFRVFLNHCKLDLNSCSYGRMWRKRPLEDCVGGKRAELQHNRGFIDWMQRVGIVDNKGRLVLS